MDTLPISHIKRAAPATVLAGLLSDQPSHSKEAAEKMILQAKAYGLGLRDYLRVAIDPRLAEKPELFATSDVNGRVSLLNGYEASLSFLNLPVRDDLDAGITLQLAADSFQTFPGVRALFPEILDDMLAWRYRQVNFENLDGLVAQSRQVSGNVMLSTIIEDTQADYDDNVRAIAQGGRIPIHAIQASQQAVSFYKFGTGYKTSYEFSRRVALDYLTPYAIRTQIEIQRSKVAVATAVLINGDGAYGAAPVVNQSSFNGVTSLDATNGTLSWKHLAAWFASRAEYGAPVDVVCGNWDAYLQWIWLFSTPTSAQGPSDVDKLAKAGFSMQGLPFLQQEVKFKLSTAVPENQLIGISQSMTIEELVETGSLINESMQSITTQEITYTKTENSGFKLVFGDTRSVFNYNA